MSVVREQLSRLGDSYAAGQNTESSDEVTGDIVSRIEASALDYPVEPVPERTQSQEITTLRRLENIKKRSRQEGDES